MMTSIVVIYLLLNMIILSMLFREDESIGYDVTIIILFAGLPMYLYSFFKKEEENE